MGAKRFPSDTTASEIRSLSSERPEKTVRDILEAVRTGGDHAVLELEHRFGGAPSPTPDATITVIDSAWLGESLESLDSDLRAALELATANVHAVAEAQLSHGSSVELPQGHRVDIRELPVKRAGVYVPGGRGSYPSTAVMCLTTAKVAGVEDICLVTPAGPDGQIDRTVAAVCALNGVDQVYAVGGAQAIAMLGYGTQSVRPVDVIVGPGNSYVQEAKRQLFGTVSIDSVAGPSELVVVADDGADVAAIALDLQAQAEHGPDSLLVLIAHDPDLIDAVIEQVGDIPAELAVVLAHDSNAAIALADEIAPEHLQIVCSEPLASKLAQSVTRAGCLFIGTLAATAFGDYVAGSNHVLPTGGSARFASALSVNTFRRRMSQLWLPHHAVGPLAEAGSTIARAEGFPLHGRSMDIRA